MTVLEYVLNSMAWSGFGLVAGIALGQMGIDLASLSGRRYGDDDT